MASNAVNVSIWCHHNELNSLVLKNYQRVNWGPLPEELLDDKYSLVVADDHVTFRDAHVTDALGNRLIPQILAVNRVQM